MILTTVEQIGRIVPDESYSLEREQSRTIAEFGISVNPISTRGAHYAHYIMDFQTLQQP